MTELEEKTEALLKAEHENAKLRDRVSELEECLDEVDGVIGRILGRTAE